MTALRNPWVGGLIGFFAWVIWWDVVHRPLIGFPLVIAFIYVGIAMSFIGLLFKVAIGLDYLTKPTSLMPRILVFVSIWWILFVNAIVLFHLHTDNPAVSAPAFLLFIVAIIFGIRSGRTE